MCNLISARNPYASEPNIPKEIKSPPDVLVVFLTASEV